MARRMSGRGDNLDAAVAIDVVISLKLGGRVLGLEAPDAKRVGPLVFGFLHEQHRLRKHLHIADVVGMGVRDRHVFDVRWLDADLMSWAARVFGRFHWVIAGLSGFCPSGSAAMASVTPV